MPTVFLGVVALQLHGKKEPTESAVTIQLWANNKKVRKKEREDRIDDAKYSCHMTEKAQKSGI
jgi:hypothetical protein